MSTSPNIQPTCCESKGGWSLRVNTSVTLFHTSPSSDIGSTAVGVQAYGFNSMDTYRESLLKIKVE